MYLRKILAKGDVFLNKELKVTGFLVNLGGTEIFVDLREGAHNAIEADIPAEEKAGIMYAVGFLMARA